MKTEAEIRAQLEQIEADERLHYEPADVFVNAPLALIQTSLETTQSVLKWVLADSKPKSEKPCKPTPTSG